VLAKRFADLQLERISEPECGARDRQIRSDPKRDLRILERFVPAPRQFGWVSRGPACQIVGNKRFYRIRAGIVAIERERLVEKRYVDQLSLNPADKQKIFEGNARRVYPRLDRRLKERKEKK
jgi:hypothetical protein